ncbi:HAD-IA family hydrolase [Porticoccus sp. GXU_MW_L64]
MTSDNSQKPAQALVLDFGSVVTLTMFETHELSERELGLPPRSLNWLGPFDPDADELWSSMQRDEISERDYWLTRTKEVGALVGETWTEMQQFVSRARGKIVNDIIRPEIPALIKAVKDAGKKLAILSNELDLFFGADLRENLTFLQDFDVIVDATYTRILKPDPRAYHACIEQLGLEAADCVFIDDQMRNVVGGNKVGMPSIHLDVRSPQQAFNDALQRLGIDHAFEEREPVVRR